MKKLLAVILGACMVIPTIAQKKNTGKFESYSNEYYGKIKESINKDKSKKEDHQQFVMNFDGVSLPKSVSEFNTAWCNDPLSQGNTGTCWCFSTSSFYESEVFRLSGEKVKLSEIYTVYWEYVAKAEEFIKSHGTSHLGEGSETNAVARMMKRHGIVPAEAYDGKAKPQEFHNHAGLFNEFKNCLMTAKNTSNWDQESIISNVKAILNFYLGEPPTKFTYKGKEYTPMSFMEFVKINPDDYVDFMSLMEKPYWKQAEYDVPDNYWNSEAYYNVPLDDFVGALKNAVKNGYTSVRP